MSFLLSEGCSGDSRYAAPHPSLHSGRKTEDGGEDGVRSTYLRIAHRQRRDVGVDTKCGTYSVLIVRGMTYVASRRWRRKSGEAVAFLRTE
jgi:hypothetical protein